MIYDCFTFWNEFDLLEIRLNELKNVVDQFVICESNVTFVGNSKKLLLSERISDYKDFNIKLLVYEGSTNPSSAWNNENGQRNFLMNGLQGCFPEDLIISSDVDEIPTAEAVSMLPYIQGIVSLEMSLSFYYINNISKGSRWINPKALKFKEIKKYLSEIRVGEFSGFIYGSGHHMTYLGGEEAVDLKLRNFAHVEFNNDSILKTIGNSLDKNILFFDSQQELKPTDPRLIKTLPKYLLNNLEKYKKHFIDF